MRLDGILLRRGPRAANGAHVVRLMAEATPGPSTKADGSASFARLLFEIRDGTRRIARAGEAVAVRSETAPLPFFADIPLAEGRYTLVFPGIRSTPQRRFAIDRDGSLLIFCSHAVRNPTSWSTRGAFSPAGGPEVVVNRPVIRRCCRASYLGQRKSLANHYSLLLMEALGGPQAIELNGKPVTIRPGEYLVVNPSDRNLPPARPRFPTAFRTVIVHQQTLRRFREAAGLDPALGPFDFDSRPRRMSPAVAQAIVGLEAALATNEQLDDFYGATVACHHLLLTLLRAHPNTLYARRTSETAPMASDPRLARALAYLRARYATPCPIEDVAREAGASSPVLRRLFQKHLGQSPLAYLQHVRVEKAKSLLQDSKLSLADIAEAVGYADERSFRRLFRAVTQKQVRAFRKG